MKKLYLLIVGIIISSLVSPAVTFAAGASVTGGGSFQVGQTFTVTVKMSGAEFDSLQGTISVSGPVSVSSFSAGGATWLPGKSPSNGGQFVGITSPTSSTTVATIKLKGSAIGSGSVSCSGVRLARNGSEVGTGTSSTKFTITRALVPAGSVTVSSTTHPNQETAYEATSATFNWDKASGVTGFSYLLDQTADTTPEAKVTDANTTKTYDALAIGTYYFHIRALNGDGWGGASHFKIIIKEPDAKIDATLAPATLDSIELTSDSKVDIENGTLTGIVFKGSVPVGYQANLVVTPADRLPADITLTALTTEMLAATVTPVAETTPEAASAVDATVTPTPVVTATAITATMSTEGRYEIIWNKPVPAGFYKIAAQGQKDKVLTPLSDTKRLEVSLANGGSIKVLSDIDANKAALVNKLSVLGIQFKDTTSAIVAICVLIIVILLLGAGAWLYIRLRRGNKPTVKL